MKTSELARPPIRPQELEGKIQTCTCPYHDGLIAESYSAADEGKVFYCPIGRMYYRFTSKWQGGFSSPLPYNHERPV